MLIVISLSTFYLKNVWVFYCVIFDIGIKGGGGEISNKKTFLYIIWFNKLFVRKLILIIGDNGYSIFKGLTTGLGGYMSGGGKDLFLLPLTLPNCNNTGFWEAAAATPRIASPARGISIFLRVKAYKKTNC